ncbi:unnamed protein product, partial [Clonostachys rosea]
TQHIVSSKDFALGWVYRPLYIVSGLNRVASMLEKHVLAAKIFSQAGDFGCAFEVTHYHEQPVLTNRRLFALDDARIPDEINCDLDGNVHGGCGDRTGVWSAGGAYCWARCSSPEELPTVALVEMKRSYLLEVNFDSNAKEALPGIL